MVNTGPLSNADPDLWIDMGCSCGCQPPKLCRYGRRVEAGNQKRRIRAHLTDDDRAWLAHHEQLAREP